jgi:hypothetical protein
VIIYRLYTSDLLFGILYRRFFLQIQVGGRSVVCSDVEQHVVRMINTFITLLIQLLNNVFYVFRLLLMKTISF